MTLRTAIVGAGIGGLTLARTLHVHGLGSVVYERDTSPDVRSQGGSLDLHHESGRRALAEAGLTELFEANARPEGEALRIVDPSGACLAHRPAPAEGSSARPEIDRARLRHLLLASLPPGTVRWDSGLVEAIPRAAGGFTLCLADGSTAQCDLLVGADGAHSRVRPLVSDAEPVGTGVSYVELSIPDAAARHPELANLVGPGSLWCLGANQNLSAQRSGDGQIRVSVTRRRATDPLDEPARAAGGTTKTALLELFAGWSEELTALIEAADADTIVPRAIAALPVGLTWPSRAGVTLIGDAAHLMPPVGEGANQAMLDGAELALAIAGRPDDPAAAVQAYERAMFARTRVVAEDSARMEAMILSPTAGPDMARFFQPS